MTLLVVGIVLWWAAFLAPSLAPGLRASLGDGGRVAKGIAALVALVLMVAGFRAADFVPVWEPAPFLREVNNTLVLLAFYCFAAAGMKTALARWLRHPMLLGVALWAVAHLLVNGDRAAIVLFGGMLVWSGAQALAINAAGPRPAPPPRGPLWREAAAVVGAVVVMIVIGLIHGWIGPQAFG